jgi:ParB/RepB/Spo0J family partition protein
MTAQTKTAVPTDSAPNTNTAPSAVDKKAWKDEIHVPEADYNASVPCDLIEPDPNNRDKIDPARVTALAVTIKEVGLLQPIVLRVMPSGNYRIMAGEHRWRAHLELARPTIAARIYRGQSDLDAAMRKSVENALRVELTPIEEAKRFAELAALGKTQKEIGALFGGISQPVVANKLRLLTLPAEVQRQIGTGRLSEAHGVALVKWAKWPRICLAQAEYAVDHEDDSKRLSGVALYASWFLVSEELVHKINVGSHYSDTPIYELPKEFLDDANFIGIANETEAYYARPEDPKEDAWLALKAKLDQEREAGAAKKSRGKDGAPSKEQIERKKVLAKNKATRTENVTSYLLALNKLTRAPSPTALHVAIMVESVIAGGYSAKRISEAATMLNITLPKGLVSDQGGHGLRDVEVMRKMDVMDLTRLAVAVLLGKQVDDANKTAQPLPENVELVMNSTVPTGAKSEAPAAELVTGDARKVKPAKKAKVAKAAKNKNQTKGKK